MAAPGVTVPGEERRRLARARLGQRVLDKWLLTRLIGVGGMAAVFEATHRSGARAAVKVLHQDLAGSDELRERFLAEGYAANRVAHPGVVAVRDEGTTEDGAVFLVMDLLRGQTLAERLQADGGLLRPREALEMASQLLDTLRHAHDRGIVHRDIKPENVFLTQDGRVRLLDFGVARIEGGARSHDTEAAGSALGTPAFMPPEQALGKDAPLDGRSDLWSLGATLYLALSGVPVREDAAVTTQLLAAMIRPARSLGEVAALPRSVVAVVDRALAFHREARFPDARSMQLAVQAALDELSASDSRVSLAPASLAPMALSTRTPRPGAAPALGPAATAPKPPRNALPIYVTLGFAVGIGIVVVSRLDIHAPSEPEQALPLGAPLHVAAEPLEARPAPLPPLSRAPAAASASSAAPPKPAGAPSTRPQKNQ